MKRLTALFLALTLALALAACAGGAAPAAPQTADASAASETPGPAAAPPAQTPAVQRVAVEAEYPDVTPFPNIDDYTDKSGSVDWNAYAEAEGAWAQQKNAFAQRAEELGDGVLDAFLGACVPALLGGAAGENRVCSPINVYLALAMSAELCDGTARAQILSLLGADGIETLRERGNALWNANYCDDGTSKSVLASSLWLRGDTAYRAETLRTLARNYYASSYSGDMGDPAFQEQLRAWLNEQTGGQLADAVESVSLDPQTVLELLTTVYFRAKWMSPFDAADTAPGVFHAPDGDVERDFMHDDWADFWAYRGAHFTAVELDFEMAGDMWFLLPDEGVTPEELLADPEALTFLISGDSERSEWYWGKLTLPKLDVSSELELSAALKALGVTEVFDPGADFSPTTDAAGVALSTVQHAARVTMDEEGVTATAFTAMGYGAGGPELEMDFTLDRPFLFKIVGDGSTPLFVGIVNEP